MRLASLALRLSSGGGMGRLRPEQLAKLSALSWRLAPASRLLTGFARPGVRIEDRDLAAPWGEVRIRLYRPTRAAAAPPPAILHLHGGGWMLGGRATGDWICSRIADDVGALVVSVDYRLAPRHPFPAALDDAWFALEWLAANAASLGASGRLGVMGDSAGGNLAAALCLIARDHGGPTIHHQALIYPATDLLGSSPSRTAQARGPILTTGDLNVFEAAYVGSADPCATALLSPLQAPSHADLPPALVIVAGHDPLQDDGEAYAARLWAADVPTRLACYPAMPHGFVNLPYLNRDAGRAIALVAAEQRKALQNTPG